MPLRRGGDGSNSLFSPHLTDPGVSWGSWCMPGQMWCDAVATRMQMHLGMMLLHSTGCVLAGGGPPCPRQPQPAQSEYLPWCWANASPCLPLSPAPPWWCCSPQLWCRGSCSPPLSVSCQWFYPMVGYVMLFYHRVEPRTGCRGCLCVRGLPSPCAAGGAKLGRYPRTHPALL